MVDIDKEEAEPDTNLLMSAKKKELLSDAMKRTSEWISSQEIDSDVTIQAGGTSFTLHKFPMVSKCGCIKKLLSGPGDIDLSSIVLPDVPGGAEAFQLAAKFCYGINFDIDTENIAALRCVAEYLEMTEEYAVGNLVTRAEAYLTEVALKSLAGAVTVLHASESLLPVAEAVKLVSRCIDTIAYVACKDNQFSSSTITPTSGTQMKPIVHWWAEDLTVLRIDVFQRVLIAMLARGFQQYALGPILMLYAQKSLRGLEAFGKGRKKIEPKQEHEKRVILETIVSLLPKEKNAMSVSFLAMLLRAAIYLETTVACRLDLEKRMGSQLGQAALDDLLIPSFSFTGDTLFDVDTVQRIVTNFLDSENGGDGFRHGVEHREDMERVGRLLENYVAEIASDRNLSVSKFIGFAEVIPEQSRVTEDGMYRAVDIYLKAHPGLSDLEKKQVCSVMDCQKLSREACAHAAQNDRLPVQTVVQVLYYEQQRLRDVMNNGTDSPAPAPTLPRKLDLYATTHVNPVIIPQDEIAALKRENQELKFELLKLKIKLKELEKPAQAADKMSGISSPTGSTHSTSEKPPLPKKSLIGSVTKRLGRLVRPEVLLSSKRTKPAKTRRHSVS